MKQVTLEEKIDTILATSNPPNDFSFKFEQVKFKGRLELNRIVIEW